jgi:thiamine kinase-like enzyme
MVETLPRNIQLKLEQSLAQWHAWQCEPALTVKPEVIRLLSPGLSNYSVLVGAENYHVVRIDGVNPSAIGLSRQTEWRVLQSAAAARIAPRPRYYNPELGSLVYDYLPADETQSSEVASTAKLLRNIHELPAVHVRLELAERILRYEKHVEHRGDTLHPMLRDIRPDVFAVLEHINTLPNNPVLCHNDLLQANRLMSGGQLLAIDWEYCAMGRPLFDLAVISVGDSLTATETETLLGSYLEREPKVEERLELAQQGYVYRYLELLWFSALDDPAEREKQLTGARFQKLAAGFQE